jgi:glycosyltransferase involved in cell wall biosynthesis
MTLHDHLGGQQPDTTIVVPFHRGLPDAACLGSLIAQENAPPFEVICIDNSRGVIADSAAALRHLIASLRPERAVASWVWAEAPERPGAGFARNAGMRAASAPWLGMLDSDDFVEADWLARFVAQRRPGACLVPPMVKLTSRGQRLAPRHPVMELANGEEVMVTSWFVETERLRAVGGWSDSLKVGEDFELSIRLKAAGIDTLKGEGGHYVWRTPERLSEVLDRGRKYAFDDLCVRALYGGTWALPFHGQGWGASLAWLSRRAGLDAIKSVRLRSWHPLLEPSKIWWYLRYRVTGERSEELRTFWELGTQGNQQVQTWN